MLDMYIRYQFNLFDIDPKFFMIAWEMDSDEASLYYLGA